VLVYARTPPVGAGAAGADADKDSVAWDPFFPSERARRFLGGVPTATASTADASSPSSPPPKQHFVNVALAAWLARRGSFIDGGGVGGGGGGGADESSRVDPRLIAAARAPQGADYLSDAEFEDVYASLANDVRDYALARPLPLPDLIDVLQDVWLEEPDGRTHEDTSDDNW
jgi:hypothetical protein